MMRGGGGGWLDSHGIVVAGGWIATNAHVEAGWIGTGVCLLVLSVFAGWIAMLCLPVC